MSFWEKHPDIGPLVISERLWCKVLAAGPEDVTDAKTVAVCVVCGRRFYGFRADAVTCSNACRQRAHQRRNGEGSPERRLNQLATREVRWLSRRDPNWRSRIPSGQAIGDGGGRHYQDVHFVVPNRFAERCVGCGAYGECLPWCADSTWEWSRSLRDFVDIESRRPLQLKLPLLDGGIGGRSEKRGPQSLETGRIPDTGIYILNPRVSDVRWQYCLIQVGESADFDVLDETSDWLHPETRKLSGEDQREHREERRARRARGSRNRWETSPEPWILPEDDASLLAEKAVSEAKEQARHPRRPIPGEELAVRTKVDGRRRPIRCTLNHAPADALEAPSDLDSVSDHCGNAPRLLRTPRPRGGAARMGSAH